MRDRNDTRRWLLVAVAWACFSAGGCATAFGAGFALMEQSARDLGTAYAGGAAAAEDAATIFFNPAGLARLPGAQVVGAAHGIFPEARFDNEGSRHLSGAPLTGGDGGNAGQPMPLSALYYKKQVSDRLHLGLGLFSPFGLVTEYDRSWVGRYHAVKSELLTLTINPCLAYRVNDAFSFGIGFDLQYLKAKLANAIDFGTVLSLLGGTGFVPQERDGFVFLKGDSWSAGYNLGALYEFDQGTRIGLAYRSRIEHTVEGGADFSGFPGPNPTGRFVDGQVTAEVTLPDSLSLSIWHNFTEDLAATADFTWTNWSTFDEIRIRFVNPAESDAVTTTSWEDSWRYALGVVYTPGPWSFRTGVAYDETPVPDGAHRTPRIPDSDRIWAAAGVGYAINDALSIDLGYAHIFVKDPVVAKPLDAENRLRGALTGTYQAQVDIVGAQLAWTFR